MTLMLPRSETPGRKQPFLIVFRPFGINCITAVFRCVVNDRIRAVYDRNLVISGRIRPVYSHRNVGPGWWRCSLIQHFDLVQRKVCNSFETEDNTCISQVNRYGYLYFRRKFASYGAVNGPCFLVILGTVIRHRILGRIFTVYTRIRAVISL
jgi:hypothetical protein